MRSNNLKTPGVALAATLLLVACAAPGGPDAQPRVFDLGLGGLPAKTVDARVGQVRASAPFDGTDMRYRLAYRELAELHAFAQSRWAAPPAELLRKHFVRAVEPSPGARCTLDIEVNEFTQVFATPDTSDALIELRVLLASGSGRVAEKTMRVTTPGAAASALQGANAMARATEDAIGRIAAWVGQQPACQTR